VRRPGAAARAAGGAVPAWFAGVMATGIVSAALRLDGLPGPGLVLLAVGAGSRRPPGRADSRYAQRRFPEIRDQAITWDRLPG